MGGWGGGGAQIKEGDRGRYLYQESNSSPLLIDNRGVQIQNARTFALQKEEHKYKFKGAVHRCGNKC